MGRLHSNPRTVVQLAFQWLARVTTCYTPVAWGRMPNRIPYTSLSSLQKSELHFAKDVYLLEPVVNLFDLNSLKDPPSLLNVQPYSLTEMERKPKL